ncbi:tyrosine-type recombinase/integrase [Viridibacillus sp. FSL R5-0468]|uniref:site-specific integrase n=1 Tax=Viridibacillus sp. FSL R5-0468 TaxID=2921640 RepID=UPI0030F6743C
MATATKRGKTWTYIVSRYVDGKYDPIRKGGFRTKPEALAAAVEIEAKLNKGVEVQTKSLPFINYFEDWIRLYKANKHQNTVQRYYDSLNIVKKYFHDKPIQKITRHEYQAMLNDYATNHAKETVRKLNTHVRACVKDAIESGYISIDFTAKVEIHGSIPAKTDSEKYIDYDEAKKLYNELFKRLNLKQLTYYEILLAQASGARFAEISGLTDEDFDFESNMISISKTWDYKTGKGFGPTKNDKSNRNITVDPRVMGAFKELLNALPKRPHNLVFFSAQSKYGVITNNSVNKALVKVLTELEIEPITIHGLRHTHASILLFKGISVYYVSERLGHGEIQTTLNTYTHILKELRLKEEKKAVEVFEEMFSEV